MRFTELLNGIPGDIKYDLGGNPEVEIKGLKNDSRRVEEGDVFVAINGYVSDGHTYIASAIKSGAAVIVVDKDADVSTDEKRCWVKVQDTKRFLGYLAGEYYGNPSTKLKLIGITGTNGKTTVATLLHRVYNKMGLKAGLVSTVENVIGEIPEVSTHTTPDAIGLNALLARMVEADCEYVFMEVSSHAIHQHRIEGQYFSGGVFTNISHDHLNYHGSFKEYIRVKKLFFDGLSKEAFALVNVDDKNGEKMVESSEAKILRYSLRTLVDYKAKILSMSVEGMLLNVNGIEFHSRLTGRFNAYNILVAFAVADMHGLEQDDLLRELSNVESAEGRFDVLRGKGGMTAIVDYAHTPDALENVLKTIKDLSGAREVITVVGCGGDRDKDKRPKMSAIAAKYSSKVILTSDNPRSEEPLEIIQQMAAGLTEKDKRIVLEIADRKQAIHTAIMMASHNAIVLVAGKGHEKYQEIKGKKYPFDDKLILKALLLDEF